MRFVRLLHLAALQARRRWSTSLLSVAVGALVAGVTVYVIGGAAHRNAELAESLRTPDVRSITIRSAKGEDVGLDGQIVRAVAQLPGISNAVAFSKVSTATTSAVPDRDVTVGFFEVVTLRGASPFLVVDEGRVPSTGEAMVSLPAATALRLVDPGLGAFESEGRVWPTVGQFRAEGLGEISNLLGRSVVTIGDPQAQRFFSVVLVVNEPADVPAVAAAIGRLFSPFGPDYYSIDYDERVAEVQTLVTASGNDGARATVVTLVAAGSAIVAALSVLSALLQRRDHARRRALGFRRRDVVVLSILHSGVLGALGISIGVAIGAVLLGPRSGSLPPSQYVATAVFGAVITTVAAIPGALASAVQDPARILRVP